jgi:DNA-binding response OmpR family regulator
MKVLIIEDEKLLSDSMVSYLKQESYTCETATTLAAAMEKIEIHDYDCILLDITLPDGNGLHILRELKANNKTDGVLIISARNSLEDKVSGLVLGADDYLPKPFHLSELGARVAAIIRRKNFEGSNLIRLNEITIDTRAKLIYVNNAALELTRKEYQLFLYFASNRGRVISKNAIVEHLWGDEMSAGDN